MSPEPAFIELDERGLEYVQEHLTGVNVFCTALLEVVQNEPGKVFTLAPFGVPPDKLHRFNEGGLLADNPARVVRLSDGGSVAPAESLKIEQAAYLLALVRETPDTACITDDFEASWHEAQALEDANAFGVGDETYRLFSREDPPAALVRALRAGDTIWHGVAAVCTEAPAPDQDNTSSIEALQTAAYSVIALTCTAYDGEGFVVWRRSASEG